MDSFYYLCCINLLAQTDMSEQLCACKSMCLCACVYSEQQAVCIGRELIYRCWPQKTGDSHAVFILSSVAYSIEHCYFGMHRDYRVCRRKLETMDLLVVQHLGLSRSITHVPSFFNCQEKALLEALLTCNSISFTPCKS